MPTPADVDAALTRVHHEEWARVVAGLARRWGDLDVAEDATAEAFAVAWERWPRDGVPTNPAAWLVTTATHKAIDRIRREGVRDARQRAAWDLRPSAAEPTGPVEDDRLRLIVVCCHPVLTRESQVTLTLRLLGGLTVAEIAHAFLARERAVAQRITRAKARIAAAGIPWDVPSEREVRDRLPAVLAVIHLVFNEGYFASGGDDAVRVDLCEEALRLARLLRTLLPDNGEVVGLLALMLLTEARRPARFTPSGALVTLTEQDRQRWNPAMLAEGHALVRDRLAAAATTRTPWGRYQVSAAINAEHTRALSAAEVDWIRIVGLYDALRTVDPSPVVRLNRAVAVAEVDGPTAGLAELVPLGDVLERYHAFHVARAELLWRAGCHGDAVLAYDRAAELATNPAERHHLAQRRQQLRADAPPLH